MSVNCEQPVEQQHTHYWQWELNQKGPAGITSQPNKTNAIQLTTVPLADDRIKPATSGNHCRLQANRAVLSESHGRVSHDSGPIG